MDFEGLNLNEFNWKKLLKIGAGVLIGLFIIRMVVMTLFFGEVFKFISEFNREFIGGQQAIHNKIEAEQEDFQRRAAEFDRTHERIGKDFQEIKEEFENQWPKHGKALAEQVVEAKSDYHAKLYRCRRDEECRENLSN